MTNFFIWNDLAPDVRARLLRRSQETIDDVLDQVRPILKDVKERGDQALIDYAAKFDKCTLSKDRIKVTAAEFEEARTRLDPALKTSIERCAANVKRFHAEQMKRVDADWMLEVEPGVFAGEKVTPISSVGIYVPGGKNTFPSAVYMLCIPAVLAGVPEIHVVTPPRKDGSADAATLYAAEISGIKNVYKVGGAQAIAALAYGTDVIPAVRKVVGPGSPYVAAAKLLLSSSIDPGMPAGPSESIVLCDGSAAVETTLIDLLNEAEHGPDSAALLVTHDEKLAREISARLPAAIAAVPEPQRGWLNTVFSNFGGVVLTASLEQSIEIANLYAPEHLLLKVENPDAVIPRLKNAGEILIGEWTAFSLGNYGTGVNHVLPTGGFAHSYSCTSVWDFLKRTSLSEVTEAGFAALSPDVELLATYEGFPVHADVLKKRRS
jgi:histidinol dehydrogenase